MLNGQYIAQQSLSLFPVTLQVGRLCCGELVRRFADGSGGHQFRQFTNIADNEESPR